MKSKRYFITGIGTNVGKTIVSAILVEALQSDYWKPIQAGNLDDSDTLNVKKLISNTSSVFHSSIYNFKCAASPHYAASLENLEINLLNLEIPNTPNHLIIEGAGGLMVPLNNNELLFDWLKKLDVEIILVVNHYLGSINHTLLTLNVLQSLSNKLLGVIFTGKHNQASEDIILRYSKVNCLGRVPFLENITPNSIAEQAQQFKFLLND